MERLWSNKRSSQIFFGSVALLGSIGFAFVFSINHCASDRVIDEYLEAMQEISAALAAGGSPLEITARSACIRYVPDDVPTRAFLWLKLPSGYHLGFILPDAAFTIADADFDGVQKPEVVFAELRLIKHDQFQKSLKATLPGYTLTHLNP